jgi:hypothetical protein
VSKLFEIGKHGDVVCAGELQAYKKVKTHIDELQAKKVMAQNWKLDIFIDQDTFALVVMNISPSAAYKKGFFEWGVFALKVSFKGYSFESVDDVLLASFPTPEATFGSVEHIATFIRHRYGLELEIKKEIRYES